MSDEAIDKAIEKIERLIAEKAALRKRVAELESVLCAIAHATSERVLEMLKRGLG